MNRLHHWYCNREAWKRRVREELVPPAIADVELGDDVLEVGPGFGPATEVLADRAERLTALEIDPLLAAPLSARLDGRARIVEGDGTDMPFPDGDRVLAGTARSPVGFSAAVCFTMLHHVPSPEAQDRLFAEVQRVLQPGATFAGTDSTGRGLGFALLHVGDTKVLIDPDDLPRRLSAAGFEQVEVVTEPDSFRFRAIRSEETIDTI